MTWNIAQAKQHFSEVVKQAAEEPQLIYNRNQPVAAVVGAEQFAAFEAWRESQAEQPMLDEVFAELRALAAGDEDPLPDPDRAGNGRVNAFVALLEEETESDDVAG